MTNRQRERERIRKKTNIWMRSIAFTSVYFIDFSKMPIQMMLDFAVITFRYGKASWYRIIISIETSNPPRIRKCFLFSGHQTFCLLFKKETDKGRANEDSHVKLFEVVVCGSDTLTTSFNSIKKYARKKTAAATKRLSSSFHIYTSGWGEERNLYPYDFRRLNSL